MIETPLIRIDRHDSGVVEVVLDRPDLAARRGSPGSVRVVGMEPHEIAKTCRRLVSRLEPDLVQARADANRATRLDVRTEAGAVGTTWLTAVLPSEVGAAIKAAVDAAGQRWRADDPDMPIGTARAMGLADLVLCGSEVTAEVRLGVPVIASAVSRLTFAPVVDHAELGLVSPAPPVARAAASCQGKCLAVIYVP